MVDSTIELIGASVSPVETEQGQEGILELSLVSGITFPIESPDGGPLRIPSGNYRFRLSRSQALEYFKQATEVAEGLPEGSNLVIPSNPQEAEAAAKKAEQMADQTKDLKNG